jgi:hypothetical protein
MKNGPKPDSAFKHSPDCAWRRLDGEAVILDLRSGVYYSLNDTAARIWELTGEGLTSSEITERICSEYEQDADVVAKDVAACLREMRSEKLILPA